MIETKCCSRRRRWNRIAVACLVVFFFAACDGGGCDIDGFSEAPFPEKHADKAVPNSGEVRVTSDGLEFLADELDNLIEEASDDGLDFCIPPTEESGAELCHEDSECDNGDTGCQLNLEIEDAEFTPEAPNRLVVDIVIGNFLVDLPATYTIDCWLHLFSESGGEEEGASIPVTLPVIFEVDPGSSFNDIEVELGELEADIDDLAYSMSNRGLAGCGAVGWGVETFLDGTLREMLLEELDDMVDELTEEELCRGCGEDDLPCPSTSTCEQDDEDDPPLCMYDEDECVPMLLGMEGVLEMEELVGDFLPRPAAEIDVTGRVADRVDADTGLSLGLRVGSEPHFRSTCIDVTASERPSFDPIDPSPSVNADVKPNGDPFMFGFGMHERTLKHLLWSIWSSGSFCVEVGPEQDDMLNTGTFELFVESIGDVTVRDGPLKIRLAPQLAPDVYLGTNDVDGDEVLDGLITLDWKDLDVHMYGFVQERYARLFTLRIDLELPIALVPDGDNALLPVLGDFEEAIQNLRINNDELIDEEIETFEELIPTLIGFALPQLMDELADPIDLPDLMGYELRLEEGDITAVDDDEYLAIFADLEYVGSEEGEGYRTAIRTVVAGEQLVVDGEERAVPEVSLKLDVMAERAGSMLPGDDVEYLYSVGERAWRVAGTGPKLVIDDPILRAQGEHQISLRARDASDTENRWQTEPTVMDVTVDYTAPTVELWQHDGRIGVDATDAVDRPEQLQMRHRYIVDGSTGAWSNWNDVASIDVDTIPEADEAGVEVEVRDRAGNTTADRLDIRRPALSPEEPDDAKGCGGCSTGGGTTAPAGLLIVFLCWMVLRLRRRSRAAVVALAAAAVLTAGCSGCSDGTEEGENQAEQCEEECEEHEECIDGECVVPACEDEGDCDYLDCDSGSFVTCDDGECVCREYCADGCGEDEFCCEDTDSCVEIPEPCDGVSCDDGYEPEVVEESSYDDESCEVDDGECECVVMPPIPIRYHGAYPSLDAGGDVMAIAVHNLGYGDLMVGIVDDDNLEIDEWHFVDGVPDGGTIGGDPYDRRGGIITSGPQVGTHTATAVDDEGVIHVFYRHESDELLKYARGEHDGEQWEFDTAVVEDDADTGFFSALRLRDDVLHLLYTARLDEGASELRHRAIDVDVPVDEMVETEFDVLHAGSTEDDGPEDYLRVAALFIQIDETDDGRFFVSFYDNTRQQAGWIFEREEGEESEEENGQWAEPVFLDDNADPYVSIRPDDEGEVHIAFMDNEELALMYRTEEGDREYVVDGIRDHAGGYSELPVGHDVQLFVDGDDVELLYHDASTHELKRAVRDEGDWEVEVVAGEAGEPGPAHGLFVRGFPAGDQRLVIDFKIDTSIDEPVGHPAFRLLD